MKNLIAMAAVVMAALGAAGCTTVPIMNVTDAAATTASARPLTADQVRTAIIQAGASLGWQMKEEAPGLLVGTLILRKHEAVVEIPYSAQAYSIKYRSSANMDEKGGVIHKNYNGWITNLTRGINARISAS